MKTTKKLLPLEALRALASIYVFLHHTLYTFDLLEKKSFFWYFFNFGQEAVIVFFILSGFVISKSLEKNNYSFKIYFLHRFTRIYSVVFISYLVSYICWTIFSNTNFPTYTDFIYNVLMLQDNVMFRPGTIVSPLFANNPLWSLSYEWWFYMLFFAQYAFQKQMNISPMKNIHIAFSLSFAGMVTFYFFPNQMSTFLMYYIIWFSGSVLNYDMQYNTSIHLKAYLVILLLFITSYILIFTLDQKYTTSIVHPFITLRHFLALFIFLIFFLIIKKYLNKILNISFIQIGINFFSLFASISFAIYLLHYPIMNAINTLDITSSSKIFSTAVLTFFIAYLTEKVFYPFVKRQWLTSETMDRQR
ncbi:acyltransferase [Sulfuricurvum sp.]|uniref:acyltransferase family protein n=1 Tax=Sulfuricurvum sp. TaxID=2025608 RepID=UPI002607543C|nr:acyltransferase [Sulfuricurvum sp.]MDD3597078.1 acyltransferase [Sulfuricurvum sp.]